MTRSAKDVQQPELLEHHANMKRPTRRREHDHVAAIRVALGDSAAKELCGDRGRDERVKK